MAADVGATLRGGEGIRTSTGPFDVIKVACRQALLIASSLPPSMTTRLITVNCSVELLIDKPHILIQRAARVTDGEKER